MIKENKEENKKAKVELKLTMTRIKNLEEKAHQRHGTIKQDKDKILTQLEALINTQKQNTIT